MPDYQTITLADAHYGQGV